MTRVTSNARFGLRYSPAPIGERHWIGMNPSDRNDYVAGRTGSRIRQSDYQLLIRERVISWSNHSSNAYGNLVQGGDFGSIPVNGKVGRGIITRVQKV